LLHASDPPVAMWPAAEISWLKGGAHCNLEESAIRSVDLVSHSGWRLWRPPVMTDPC
jgi:hypothetical protein